MALAVSQAVGTAIIASGAGFAAASAAATIAYLAVTVAPLALAAYAADRARQSYGDARSPVNDERGLQQQIPEAAPEWLRAYGTAITSGKPFFYRGGEENRPYFWLGVLLAAHQIDGLEAIWLNNNRILINPATGLATAVPYFDGVTAFIEVSVRNGSIDQAIDPIIARDFAGIPATFRQRGHATAVFKVHYGTGATRDAQDELHKSLFGDGQFNPLVEFRGAKVYDPRAQTQVLADSATWQWSNNASLCIADWLCDTFPHMRARIDWEAMKEAADIDGALVYTKAGAVIAQHTLDGIVRSGDDAASVLEALLSANGGAIVSKGGKISVRPAAPRSPVGTLHSGNQRGGWQYSAGKALGQTVNEVRAECMLPERNFKVLPIPVIADEAALAADGTPRAISARLSFTRGHERGQRIAARIFKQARLGQRVLVQADFSALGWQIGDVITLDRAELYEGLAGTWQIERKGWDFAAMAFAFDLARHDNAAFSFDPATEEQDFDIEEITA